VQHPAQWGVGAGTGAALEEEVESEGVGEHVPAAHATVQNDGLVSDAGAETGAECSVKEEGGGSGHLVEQSEHVSEVPWLGGRKTVGEGVE
jgi:hypothetical protein